MSGIYLHDGCLGLMSCAGNFIFIFL